MDNIKVPKHCADFEYYKLRARQLRNEAIRHLFKTGALSFLGALRWVKHVLSRNIYPQRRR